MTFLGMVVIIDLSVPGPCRKGTSSANLYSPSNSLLFLVGSYSALNTFEGSLFSLYS